jgi:hydrogenase maturation protein HypF
MERRAIVIRGIVQGVGFRPFVYNLALRLRLAGFVKNQTGTVLIEVEGAASDLDRFLAEISGHPPPLAQIEHLSWERRSPRGEQQFRIDASESDPSSPVFISPDVATCAECLAEVLDPADRRYRYPFLNCTNCGPRLTIITGAPYDRQRTTMAAFPMCPACRAEYEDPTHRRFHAQPTACPVCGPRLQAVSATGEPLAVADPLAWFAEGLRAGKLGALKGLGGYHLACDARNAAAVRELRRRKHRDEKPFAVMVADVETAAELCAVEPAERDLLLSPRRPIVLLKKHPLTPQPPLPPRGEGEPDHLPPLPLVGEGGWGGEGVAEEVAPRNPWLGVMLPYTPLHHLLLRAVGGIPLVMTSGNRSDEPIAYRDDEALTQLAGIADLFLLHNRPIHVRCDDSVTRVVAGAELPLRRSRGYAPQPITLPFACPVPILAVGGQLKGTFALGRDRQAFLSHHLGDLDHYQAYRAFEKDVALYEELFAVRPACLAHDLHPDYATTRYATAQAAQMGTPLLAVQHHHAHLASCMAEHGLAEPVIGVTFDGTGYGTDGAVWGGEFLVGEYRSYRRAAHLRYVGLPGGDQAVRESWRMAVAHLLDAGLSTAALEARLLPLHVQAIKRMLERRFQTPLTSSAGRLFDAVAALAGVRDRVSYEGQAAIELEWLAMESAAVGVYPFDLGEQTPLVVDTRPLIEAVAAEAGKGVSAAVIARRFHSTVVEMIAAVCGRLRGDTGLEAVVLSGGVFLNALLTQEVSARLREDGFRVYRHRLVPPNDGGLSPGQLAVAAARLSAPGGSAGSPQTC